MNQVYSVTLFTDVALVIVIALSLLDLPVRHLDTDESYGICPDVYTEIGESNYIC